MKVALVGGSGGIGRALLRQLVERSEVRAVHATFHNNPPDFDHPKVSWQPVDLTQASSIHSWSEGLGEVDWLINAAGILHTRDNQPEKNIRQLQPDFFLRSVSTNTLSTLLLAKSLQDHFKHGRSAVFAAVSAKVGSISDNRLGGWYSYRASKAALNMCMKTLAIEWRRTLPNVTVAALHPGTTDTALSKPFQRNVAPDALFSPEKSAALLLDVLATLTPDQSGGFWSYSGERLPW